MNLPMYLSPLPSSKVKGIIDKVIQSPLSDIASALSGFSWEYGKGNFLHWSPLFVHFNAYFKTYLSGRSDLLMAAEYNDDEQIPKEEVLKILRVMQIILENCHNKSTFTGLEYFKLLLASTDPEILIATLETLCALVKTNSAKRRASTHLIGCSSVINSCLLSLAQGWGSKEEGLGLYSHISSDRQQYQLGSTLYFGCLEDNDDRHTRTRGVIHIPDIHLQESDDFSLMKQLVDKFNVPLEHRFSLLTRIRYARAFHSAEIRRLYCQISILAFIVLVQSGDAHDELVSLFEHEPEYMDELIRIVKSEEMVPLKIRTLAVHALSAHISVYSTSGQRALTLSMSRLSCGDLHCIAVLDVLQKEIDCLSNTSDPTSIGFLESLLQFYLLHVTCSSTSRNQLRDSGLVHEFLSILEDTEPSHMHLVRLGLKTLKNLLDHSNPAINLFMNLRGLEILTGRLYIEVNRALNLAGENTDILTARERLIRILLKALGAPLIVHTNAARSRNSWLSSLPATLSLLFRNPDYFGGNIYNLAVNCMVIRTDPTSFTALEEIGLLDDFLTSVVAGVPPSREALICVPKSLVSICLNDKGLKAVEETSALQFLVNVFTTRKYVLALNDGINILADKMEELVRNAVTLRSIAVDLIIEILNIISSIEKNYVASSSKVHGSISMETNDEGTMSDNQFIQLCFFHVMVLIHKMMENAETYGIFVEKSGIDAFFELLLRPAIAQSPEAMSIAMNSTLVFKGFMRHNCAPLAKAFCSALRGHVKKALDAFESASVFSLFGGITSTDSQLFSHFFLVELLLTFAASNDNVWLSELHTEFGNAANDVLLNTVLLHRQLLWQMALLVDTQPQVDVSVSSTLLKLRQSESTLSSFVQHLDPLMQRRMSGWVPNLQFSKLSSLYIDLIRAAGLPQRHGLDVIRSICCHVTCLFQELGEVMLIPYNMADVSSSGYSVARTLADIVLKDWPCAGSEAPLSAKCRFLGMVGHFIDSVLSIKTDSCNPVILSCFLHTGVIKSIMDKFEGACQLLFPINKGPAFPVEMKDGDLKQDEEKESDNAWAFVPLGAYGKLMDHLVTKNLLTQPRDAGTLVKVIQSMVLKVVLPIWAHPYLTECSSDFIARVISIICHVYPDVEARNISTSCKAQQPGPSPSESTVSTLIEMGFSRSRTKESLPQVGPSSFEPAAEWLNSHPDDEISCAPAMSLEQSISDTKDDITNKNSELIEGIVQLPLFADLLSTSMKLLELKESLAFPVRDLLLQMSTHNYGEHRSDVISHIIDQVKHCDLGNGTSNRLFTLFHVLALIFHEDTEAREAASQAGLVEVALSLLSQWFSSISVEDKLQVPKWVTAAFLAIYKLLGTSPKNVSFMEQERLIDIACDCLRNQLSSDTMHTVLLLCSTLTQTKSIAVQFLDSGGLARLLSLPARSLFTGFDTIAATIIYHILDNTQTLQAAMECEIRRSFETAANSQFNGKITPRSFLVKMSSSILRDPNIFMLAAQSVCQVEMVGERPYIVLVKNREETIHNMRHLQSFVNVIELLQATVIMRTPPMQYESSPNRAFSAADLDKSHTEDISVSEANIVFVLNLLREILFIYPSSLYVLLHEDVEVNNFTKPAPKDLSAQPISGLIRHIICKFNRSSKSFKKEKGTDDYWNHELASKASQFLVTCCTRSADARKMVFLEINNVLSRFLDSSSYFRPPESNIPPLVELLNDIVSARTETGEYSSAEASATFIDAGLLTSLTRIFEILDLDHIESQKTVENIIKILEVILEQYKRNEQIDLEDDDEDGYEFDEETTEEFPEVDEHEDDRSIHQLEGEITGMDFLEYINVMHSNNSLGSMQQGNTSSIYDLLIRSHDYTTTIFENPLLLEPSSSRATSPRRSDFAHHSFSHRNSENILAALDDVFQSLRNGHQGHSSCIENKQASRSNSSTVLDGLEDFLVSTLRSPAPEKLLEPNDTPSQPEATENFIPLVSTEALQGMLRVLWLPQPLYKDLQKLLVHLCANSETRSVLVDIVVDLLMLDTKKSSKYMFSSKQSHRLYSSESHIVYSRPQALHGIPPLVFRRLLETLTYLVINHPLVERLVFQLRDGELPFFLLLSLLVQPLYLRSGSQVEVEAKLNRFLMVIIGNPDRSDDSETVLCNIPQAEVRGLCSLLARNDLTHRAYWLVIVILRDILATAPTHSLLLVSELADLVRISTKPAMDELRIFGETEKSLITRVSSDGNTMFWILTALSSVLALIYYGLLILSYEDYSNAMSLVYDISSMLEPLWMELSSCISKLESFTDPPIESSNKFRVFPYKLSAGTTPLLAGANNILPYIQSYFLICKNLEPGQRAASQETKAYEFEDVTTSAGELKAFDSVQRADEMQQAFVEFSDRHRKILNAFIRKTPQLLDSTFSILLKVPHLIDFDNKRLRFRSNINHHPGLLKVSVRRSYILEDSYDQLQMRSSQDMKKRLKVHFQGEEGIDEGGLTREWYQLLSRVIFDKGALLFTTVGNDSTFQPNPNSVYQTEHLSYFKFIGQIVGKAIFDEQLLNVHFTRSFYKHILGVKVSYHDIEAIDPDYFKNLKWMLENDISDVLDLTFSTEADEENHILYEKTELTDYELIPGGRNIRVTEENKHEYVDLVAEYRLTTAIRPQINAFLEGFYELIPCDFISIFQENELELLISGLPDIDLDDMRAHTEYSGYGTDSPVVQWFWEVAQCLSKEDKARLLQFVTGTSKVPLEGFSALQGISGTQKFQIHKAYESPDHLPSAHTCLNQLELPEYRSKEQLEEKLLFAIYEANEGFGFA